MAIMVNERLPRRLAVQESIQAVAMLTDQQRLPRCGRAPIVPRVVLSRGAYLASVIRRASITPSRDAGMQNAPAHAVRETKSSTNARIAHLIVSLLLVIETKNIPSRRSHARVISDGVVITRHNTLRVTTWHAAK
ncbi:MAG: hypothetical protein WC670_11255, partial [Pseudolabrys sp.]